MGVEYQIIEKNTGTELFKTKNHKKAKEEFKEHEIAPCRTVGNYINVNGKKRIISQISFCIDYEYKEGLRLVIEVE